MLFYLVFLVVGLIALGVGVGLFAGGDESVPWFGALIPTLVGTVFAGIGGAMFYFGTRPVVFDRQFGWFHKGRGGPPMAHVPIRLARSICPRTLLILWAPV